VTFLAHQAPVLPLIRKWRGVDGVALVAGSMVPDLAVATQHATPRYLLGVPLWWEGHTLSDQLNWCLPVGLLLTWLLRRLILPTLAPYLPDAGGFHLQDLRHVGRVRYRWWVIAGCVLLGSVSHVLVDGLTHADGWAVGVVPGLTPTVARVLQVVASIGLSVWSLRELWLIGRARLVCDRSGATPDPAMRPDDALAVRSAGFLLLLGCGAWALTQTERGRTVVVVTWFVLSVLAATALALVVRWRNHRRDQARSRIATT
jgi:hypothetical protein